MTDIASHLGLTVFINNLSTMRADYWPLLLLMWLVFVFALMLEENPK